MLYSMKSVPLGEVIIGLDMAWHWKCDTPVPKPVMTLFNDAYMRHCEEMD